MQVKKHNNGVQGQADVTNQAPSEHPSLTKHQVPLLPCLQVELSSRKWRFFKRRLGLALPLQIGLGAQLKLEQLGTEVVSPGSSVARGLSEQAARELGLNSATKVGGILEFEHSCNSD